MSSPNESDENIFRPGQPQDVSPFSSAQDLPSENKAAPTTPAPDDALKNRRKTGLQGCGVILLGCIIIFVLFFHLSSNVTPKPLSDAQITQTAQANLAQETSTVSAGNATAIALETVLPQMSPQAIYQKYTQGKPLFRDPLNDFNSTYFYDPDTMKPDPGCVFKKDGLHITWSESGTWIPCNNSAFPDLMSFSFQYDFAILKGDGAGLRFRANGTAAYYFSIDEAGKYSFIYFPDVTNSATSKAIQSGVSNLMNKGYGVKNQLTLIAIGDVFYFYLNQNFLTKVTDQTLTMGGLSLLTDDETAPTEAVFSQAVAWNIAGMAP